MHDASYPLGGLVSPFGGGARWFPRRLFGAAEAGFYLDFSSTAPLYQDTLAATPLTLPDQSVGLAADRSRARSPITVAAAVQASLGLRPKWGRMPKTGRRNLLTYTEQFDNAAWTKNATVTVTSNSATSPIGDMTADTVSFSENFQSLVGSTTTSISGLVVTGSIYVKGVAGETITIAAGGIDELFTLNGQWQRLSLTKTAITDTINTFNINTFVGATARVINIWGAQLEAGGDATAYQAVTNAFDVTEAGVPSYGYIRPDLMDDYLTVTTPAAQSGDVMVFGRKGTWLETGVAYGSGAAVAIGPTTMTGLPAGLLQAVQGPVSDISGGLVGVLAIGRTLTEAERTAALNYYKARGAAGLLALGPELVTNGDFATNSTANWTEAITGGTLNASTGQLVVNNAAGSGNTGVYQVRSCTSGQYIRVSIEVLARTEARLAVFNGTLGTTIYSNNALPVGTSTFIVGPMLSGTFTVYAHCSAGNTATFDNVSVKPLTVTP